MNLHPEVTLLGGYAAALLAVAAVLDWLAQHTQRRSERFRTAGFRYHAQHDAWICPQDEMLWPIEYDAEQHLVRYRAKPSVCNACPVKSDCTSSPHGREVTRALAPWPHSEAGRFHRGVSLVLIGLAALLLLIAAARHPEPPTLVLGLPLLLAVLLGHRFSAHFRDTPANFPAPTSATGLRVTRTSRTRWRSDAREDT
jgi:hypothetical protein